MPPDGIMEGRMVTADFIIAGILVIIIGAAIAYMIKEKKKGTRCIGCPSAGQCSSASSHEGSGCGCSSHIEE